MEDEPLTHIRPSDQHGHKTCQCQKCGVIAKCTQDFDFYVTSDDVARALPGGAPLYCEPCFYEVTGMKDAPVLEFPPGPFKVGDLVEGKKAGRHAVFMIERVDEDGGPVNFREA